jgi:CubicO group peptidase (beta-lactamase class C family)
MAGHARWTALVAKIDDSSSARAEGPAHSRKRKARLMIDSVDRRYRPSLLIRRLAIVALGVGMLGGCATQSASPGSSSAASVPSTATPASADPAQAAAVDKVVQEAMNARHLRAVIVRVTVDGKEIITKAYGESMTGMPATVDMHFRNGAVAISYVSTLLLRLVDEKKVSLEDKASKWVPEIPHSDEVTLGQLAQMTSGYTDYVIGNQEFGAMLYAEPFRQWTPEELLATVTSKPLLYPPGTNWNYAHTNYLILGLALERATGNRMSDLLQEKVLGPLGLTNTTDPGPGTPPSPSPRCTPSPPNVGHSWAFRREPDSMRSPLIGIRRGRSPAARSRRRTSSI